MNTTDESVRECLASGSTIMLSRNPDGSSPEEYIVESVLGEGGSTVCYEARRIRGDGIVETGKLKEFYPIDVDTDDVSESWKRYYSLQRLSDGQLVPGPGTIRKFEDMCRDYINSYKLLKDTIAMNPRNEVLKGYIQDGEILYGCMNRVNPVPEKQRRAFWKKKTDKSADMVDDRRPTVYIWSPGVAGKGFDTYLSEIRKNPAQNPEERLYEILCVMETLADCIKAVHHAGLMHLDIKPSNFLVQYDSDFKINPNNISLFDINTLISVDSKYLTGIGTDGFRAPELLEGSPENRSDIYSIGAMLFNAIVITKEIPDGLYRDSDYSNIVRLVQNSELFLSSETNSAVDLMSLICEILKKCLAKDPHKRYRGCSYLKNDLNKAKERLYKMMHMPPVPKSTQGEPDSKIAIQKLLYEHPLYDAVESSAKEINVLVIGPGTYGQKFIDICLQAGQISGVELNIDAVSYEPKKNMNDYLQFRPAMREFVNINGSLDGREELAYAALNFRNLGEQDGKELEFINEKLRRQNEEIIDFLIAQSQKKYDYVFVSLGDDSLNTAVAELFSEKMGEISDRCHVCYVIQNTDSCGETCDYDIKRLYPVCVNAPVADECVNEDFVDKSLSEMAFNTHLSWMDSLNIDVTGEREKFFKGMSEKEKYNRRSSSACALSIKYKLHSVGIDCSDFLEAARQFSKQILERRSVDDEAEEKFNSLAAFEHRRWLIAQAADGWTAPKDEKGRLLLEDCVRRGSVKDSVNKTHPCMVRSTKSSPLSGAKYTENEHKLWDYGEIDGNLDELDRMSIELHRCFRNKAEMLKKDNLMQNPDLVFIRELIPNKCVNAKEAFKQLQFALKSIINGVERYSRQYDYYQDEFKKSLDELPEENKKEIKERLERVKRTFFPINESNLYRNYKANDENLIEKIPFILTYRYMSSIAMPFEDDKYQNGRNEAVFANVAAATVLSPETIRFLYCFDKSSKVDLLVQKLDAALNYFGKRNVHCGIELFAACLNEVPYKEQRRLEDELKRIKNAHEKSTGNSWFEKITICGADTYAEAAAEFAEYLKQKPVNLYGGGNALFPSAYDNVMFIEQIEEMKIPYFEFDWRKKEFTRRIGCEYLQFVKDDSFIRIRDMFALMNAADNKFNFPEFAEDYKTLWEIYTGGYLRSCSPDKKFENGVRNWNHLCMCLKKYESEKAPLAKIPLGDSHLPKDTKLVYFLPEYTYSTVKSLVQRLADYGIVNENYTLTMHASDTCKMELVTSSEYVNELNAVFWNPQSLLPYYEVEVCKYKTYNNEFVEIRCNDTRVTNVNLNYDGANHQQYDYELLKTLQTYNFISQLPTALKDASSVSFVYASHGIKKLLTLGGEILEVYAYYEALKTGYFDDVACGYEFRWESGEVKNELDLVLTKGFRSIIVECKAVAELKQDYYHKLHSLADRFGIGTTQVLLGNTYSTSNDLINEQNTMQISRGEQLDIKTISDKEEIINIGQTLKSLMEEN